MTPALPALSALSRIAPILLVAAALASACAAAEIFEDATRPRRENGFVRLERPGGTCEPDAAFERAAWRSIEPEPYVLEMPMQESCIVWRAFWAVHRPTALEMEIESDDDGSVRLDGSAFLTNPGVHGRSARTATRDVAPGVH